MKIVNIGSLNVDHVYQVDHFSRPGESLISRSYARFAGGKGANQSMALARAGGRVLHCGKIGEEGRWMVAPMAADGVDVTLVRVSDQPGGHAVIHVDPDGQNSIVVYGGTNQQFGPQEVSEALGRAEEGDLVLLQNEINAVALALRMCGERGLFVAFNAAPMTQQVADYPLEHVSLFFVNETEGRDLVGSAEPDAIIDALLTRFPRAQIVVTLGADGAAYRDGATRGVVPARRVQPVDTTGAGDTFIGYAMTGLAEGLGLPAALELATEAAALCVTRAGAAASIPYRRELRGSAR